MFTAPAAAAPPVITTLVTQSQVIAISAGQRFTIADHLGQVEAVNLSEEELLQEFPGVHRIYRTSFGGNQTLWAGR